MLYTKPSTPSVLSSNIIKYVVYVGIVVLLILGIWMYAQSEFFGSQKRSFPVVLSLSPGMSSLPVLVAIENKYFQDEGIALEVRNFTTGKQAMEDMFQNKTDIATAAALPVAIHSFARDDFKVLAEFVTSDDNEKIVTRTQAGIADVSDLRGKKVGLTQGTSAAYFFDSYTAPLATGGVQPEVIHMPPSELADALAEGFVDAVAIWEPTAYLIQKRIGEQSVRLEASPELYRATFILVASDNFLASNQGVAVGFLRAVERANMFIKTNPQQAQDIAARVLEVEKSTVKALWDTFNYRLFIGQETVLNLENQAQWLAQNNLVEAGNVPNFLDVIYAFPLMQILPRSVNIVQ